MRNRRRSWLLTDNDDFGIDGFAFGLGFGEMVADEERERLRMLKEDKEPLIPDEDAPQWYEKD